MRRDPPALQSVAQSQGIHHRREHAHMIAGNPATALLRHRYAAEDVAAAGNQPDPDAKIDRLADLAGKAVHHLGVDAIRLVAEKSLAGDLEKDSLEAGLRRHRSDSFRVANRPSGYTMLTALSPAREALCLARP